MPFAGYFGVRPTRWASLHRARGALAVIAIWAMFEPSTNAKVPWVPLAELVDRADFVGVVRVEHVRGGIPFVRKARATARILESWKGPAAGTVAFVAGPTWTCDISDAKKGEEAVVFIRGGSLEHSGRGRMPIFVRDGRRLATIWPDVRLPEGVVTEAGPQAEFDFIRAIDVDTLRRAVSPPVEATR